MTFGAGKGIFGQLCIAQCQFSLYTDIIVTGTYDYLRKEHETNGIS
jgi:hypothetical protein